MLKLSLMGRAVEERPAERGANADTAGSARKHTAAESFMFRILIVCNNSLGGRATTLVLLSDPKEQPTTAPFSQKRLYKWLKRRSIRHQPIASLTSD